MTFARHEIYDPEEVGVYHCISRCVRRAFLCGKDPLTNRSFEHRRKWIRDRLTLLADIFAIEVIAYAVMSNHLHCVMRNRPDVAAKWSDKHVAERWRKLFPLRRKIDGSAAEPSKAEVEAIAGNKKMVQIYRARLSDISWFNRCMNENIARRANAEDECTGRFWEGRFKCQKVYEIGAILACSVYVDLNPIRAGIANTPEDSDFTSVQDRIDDYKKKDVSKKHTGPKLLPIEEISEKTISLEEYLELVDTTGRLMHNDKASMPTNLKPILERIKVTPSEWLETTKKLRRRFNRIVGPHKCIEIAAKKAKKEWFHGIAAARLIFA